MNRREFARILAIGGAVPFVTPDLAWARGLLESRRKVDGVAKQ